MTRCLLGTLMALIATREGFYRHGSFAARCHNPGALVFVGQPLATVAKGSHHFACFTSDDAGWDALRRDLGRKLDAGRTLQKAWRYLTDGYR